MSIKSTLKNLLRPFYRLLGADPQEKITVVRFDTNPIIRPDMLKGDDGANINGPSLLKVPEWIASPLGKYYLYFAHHKGSYIRLAYADEIAGPWKIYDAGALHMEDCLANLDRQRIQGIRHIASPDVFINTRTKELVMYFHGQLITVGPDGRENFPQFSLRATSKDGIVFKPEGQILGNSYFRVFKWNNQFYALAKPGIFYKSRDGISNFESGPNPFLRIENPTRLRHSAVLVKENTLYVFYSRAGDKPERILLSKVQLTEDWNTWKSTKPVTILEPEMDYEGVNQPLAKSVMGISRKAVRELRDPAIFEDNGKMYLLYSVAGELGIAIAEITMEDRKD